MKRPPNPLFPLQDLNPSQRDAVTTVDGPLLILAGAGSGKTRVITYRIAYLLQERNIPPYAIMAVTFTNKAAGEMRERVISLAGREGRMVWISTFHSACVRILRQHADRMGISRHFTIADDSDSLRIIKGILKEMNVDERVLPARRVSYLISRAKNALVEPEGMADLGEVRRDHLMEKVVLAYGHYEERLRASQALDFDDLLFFTFRLFEGHPDIRDNLEDILQFIMVDEYQDTNHAQYQIIRHLSARRRNICVVGDDDQSIYRWRGADITNILSFESDFPEAKVVSLMENYRSTGHILKAASCLISRNLGRKDKELRAVRPDGLKVSAFAAVDERDEADFISATILDLMRREGFAAGDFAVFYRINAQSRAIEDSMRRNNIPHAIVGGVRFYDRMEIRDTLAYLRLILNPADWTSFERVINAPARGIGKVTLEKIRSCAAKDAPPEKAVLEALKSVKITKKAASALSAFLETMGGLRDKVQVQALDELVVSVMDDTGYLPALQSEDTEAARNRIENLQEFLTVVHDFLEISTGVEESGSDTLSAFLDQVSLVSDIDSWEDKGSAVTLMTLHMAKGLEFPVVFLAGMEEDLLPHYRSQGEPAELEEERRLCYVGMTRSRERLFLTLARRRRIFGQYDHTHPSRFFSELPDENVELHSESAFPILGLTGRGGPSRIPSEGTIAISEFHYEPEPVEGEETLLPGTEVSHPMFGVGQVMGVEGEGGDARITVYFPKGGKKKLIAKYANLRVI
ncbi:MAG: UvrD-helicase domain-containing protein [bacterium]|nr:MAG: UvrD-helicase domain-containing protein [bacterium]